MFEEINWHSFIISRGTFLVYFYSPLCGTCKEAEKMLRVSLLSLPEEIPSYRCNLNFAKDAAEQLKISSVPCLMIWKDGVLQDPIYAFRSSAYLFELLKQIV